MGELMRRRWGLLRGLAPIFSFVGPSFLMEKVSKNRFRHCAEF